MEDSQSRRRVRREFIRAHHPDLFTQGDATRLEVDGDRANDILAIARHHGNEWLLALAPRAAGGLRVTVQLPSA